MIFQATLDKVLSGEKTQTRRVVKEDEFSTNGFIRPPLGNYDGIMCIYKKPRRTKYQVGKTYAIQPGRGKKAVGRIKITAIRRERLQDITEEDARAEGVNESYWDRLPSYKDRCLPGHLCRAAFADVWTTLNYPKGERWQDDPEVWVIEFERVS